MKQSLQTKSRVDAIVVELAAGKEREDIMAMYREKWQTSVRTFDRLLAAGRKAFAEMNELANREAQSLISESAREMYATAIRKKEERIMNLQRQIDDLQARLDVNQDVTYYVIKGRVQKVTTVMRATDRATLQKAIVMIETELSKIQGHYAPVKNAFTDPNGEETKMPVTLIQIPDNGRNQNNSATAGLPDKGAELPG
jgi:hypothetical protein